MRKHCQYWFCLPAKVAEHLPEIEELIRPTIKGFSPDNLKEVISILSCHIRKDEADTPLKMNYLKMLVPQGDRYLKGLIDLGIIARSGHYMPGKFSYNYTFDPEYWSKYVTAPLRDARLKRRIEKAQDILRKEADQSVRGRSEQVRYLRQLTVSDNYSELTESNPGLSEEQYNHIIAAVTRIKNGDIRYQIDNTSGRFHSNITNMAKGLRPYLLVKNQRMINVDVKNCQPYLSTIILTNPGKVSWMTENTAFALLLQTLKVSHKQDVKHYISLVVSGQLYEYLKTEFLIEGLELNRDETKRQVLRILFARNRMPKDGINRKCRQIFKDRFPTVHRIFSKVRGHEKGDKFQNFKRFAILLQRIE
ncbi:MAG: hypothetical protein JXB00_06130, partial [Bacteroidales bacterium]|nr:hypothetical protein [Bacteroidales bacterium]